MSSSASTFPASVVLHSVYTGHYVRYMTEDQLLGYVGSLEENVFSPKAKIEVEKAKVNDRFVHLRFSFSNKYWARYSSSESGLLIFPRSNQPEEDTTKWSCTMFEPIRGNDGVLYLRHVQTGKRVRVASTASKFLYIDSQDKDEEINWYAFTFVDWDSLVIIPEMVAFKGDNDKFLISTWLDSNEYLQYSSEDGNEQAAAFEVTMNPDGYLRFKSIYSAKFWRRSPNWIWADSTDSAGQDIDTLFWPVKVSDDTIALRNAGNNKFCKRLTIEGKTSCLNASDSTITRYAKIKVEELVLKRDIYDVYYRVGDARIYDESAFIAGTGSATNQTDKAAQLTVKVSYQNLISRSFKHSESLKLGVKTSIMAGFPAIVEGKIEISAEVTVLLEWNTTTTDTKTAEASYQAVVPPMSTVRVNYVATRGSCDVPFSYTQRDQRSLDGTYVTSEHVDGTYTGLNYYNFHFEQVAMELLN